jgi:hypothetical protein
MEFSSILGFSTLVAAVVTAIATALLWRVTGVLARETTRLADATGQPQIVAVIRANQWTLMYADLIVTNSGNASAFDIEVAFDPPLRSGHEGEETHDLPLKHLSILRPGESLSSDIGQSYPLLEQRCKVTTSWLRRPDSILRESLTYDFCYGDIRGSSQLGAADPLVQIADQIKHIREDWRNVASGQRRLKADAYSGSDRVQEGKQRDRNRKLMIGEMEKQKKAVADQSGEVS